MRNRLSLLVCLALLIAACASVSLPAGTLVLAQVAHVATEDDLWSGVEVDGTSLIVPPHLLKPCAFDAASLESGDLAVMRVYKYSPSGAPQQRSSLWWVAVPKGMVVNPGDFVEVELKPGLGNGRCPYIARVRSPSTASGECEFVRNPRGSMSIYCEGLEREGWTKHLAPDRPDDGPVAWRKAPAS